MNGYLVVISSSMDDVPVRLCESESFAREFAETVDTFEAVRAVRDQRCYFGDVPERVRIQRFVDGVSVTDEVVRELETEYEDEKGGAS